MGYLLVFLIYCIMFIGVVITTLFINQYSFVIAICFDILYIITVKSLCKELENQ